MKRGRKTIQGDCQMKEKGSASGPSSAHPTFVREASNAFPGSGW